MTEDDSLWHKCQHPLIPRRTIDGGWILGMEQVWRRRRSDGIWEYQQGDESPERWLERQV